MAPQGRPLPDPFDAIPDPRQARGRRPPLAAMRAHGCALLGGHWRDRAMADWGRGDGQQLARALGFTHHQPPCAATWHHGLRRLDSSLVAAAPGSWAASVL